MVILQQSALFSPASPPVPILLLPAPPKHLALPAPKIGGYLSAPACLTVVVKTPVKRVVEAEIANPLLLIDIRKDFDAWWAEFERIHGRVRTTEEMDAELEAKFPGYMARYRRSSTANAARTEAAS